MIKLSDLVKLKLELKQYAITDLIKSAATTLGDNLRAVRSTTGGIEYDAHVTDVIKTVTKHIDKLDKEMQDKVNQIIEDIDRQIQEQASTYFAKGYKSFASSVENDRADRKLPVPSHIQDALLGRIRLYSDWHYPGMEIGPHDGEYTKFLVASDPLYLVDVHTEYLESAVSQFTPEFQARVRTYNIGHRVNTKGLVELPQNQFGFVFSWNTFNYLPLDEVQKYLVDVFAVLRPGGTFLFSYNDGDTYNGARHAEWTGMSYMPKSLLTAVAEGYGFEVTNSFGFETEWHNISWLEIKKPGTLSTIKAHQTLGIIKDIEQ